MDISPKRTHNDQQGYEKVLNTSNRLKMQIRITMKHHLTPVKMGLYAMILSVKFYND